jgi:hypothetical protein
MATLSSSEPSLLSSPLLSSDCAAVSVYSASDMPAPARTPHSINAAITTTTTAVNFSAAVATNSDVNQNQTANSDDCLHPTVDSNAVEGAGTMLKQVAVPVQSVISSAAMLSLRLILRGLIGRLIKHCPGGLSS